MVCTQGGAVERSEMSANHWRGEYFVAILFHSLNFATPKIRQTFCSKIGLVAVGKKKRKVMTLSSEPQTWDSDYSMGVLRACNSNASNVDGEMHFRKMHEQFKGRSKTAALDLGECTASLTNGFLASLDLKP